MTQAYSDPKRESNSYALPDVETFYLSESEIGDNADKDSCFRDLTQAGWYYWACFPGCLPDSDPFGPFETEEQAIKAAQEDFVDFDDEESDDDETEESTDNEIDGHYCPICGGDGFLLGSLGNVTYFRCRQCGMDFTA